MLLGILLISLAISANARVADVYKNDQRTVCTTQECRHHATAILSSMKKSADPCVDFYEYACGNWPKNNPIPSGKNAWKVLMVANQENKRHVENLLQSSTQSGEIQPVKIVKQWYKACTDTADVEKRGMKPVASILSGIGGWPMLMAPGKWNENKYNWQAVDDYYTQVKGSNSLHEVRAAVLGSDATDFSVVLDFPSLPPASWLLTSELDEDDSDDSDSMDDDEDHFLNVTKKMKKDGVYWNFVVKVVRAVAVASGSNVSQDKVNKDIEDLLNFQYKLAKMTYTVDEYVNRTLKNFQNWHDGLGQQTQNAKVNWTRKIINVFKDAKVNIDVNTNMKVTSLNFFKRLAVLLDQTPSRTIVNYIHWNFVSHMLSKTTKEMKKLLDNTNAGGEDQEDDGPSRPQSCIQEAKMNDIIAYEYIRQHFSTTIVKKALNAMDDIEKEIAIQIENSNWADKATKDFALKKLRTIKKNVAYPEWYNDAKFMNNYFDGLSMGPKYFENSLNLDKYYTLKALRALKHEELHKPWIVDPLTINAFYLTQDNSITIPAANLEEPFFSEAQPNTVNYALTGYLAAHEMNHGFDYQRHIYDETGKEIEWPAAMKKEYLERVQCFVDQFDSYTLDGTPNGPRVPNYGNQTVEENMSDTMGLIAGFKAYKRRQNMNGKPDAVLPGLESFTNDQIYFLTFGNLFCENVKPEFLLTLSRLDDHSAGRLRVNGALSNNDDFAKTFSCPAGSRMNPEKKCSIWKKYAGDNGRWTWWKSYHTQQV